ncbi:MAG TPA: hypothetical protein VIN01_07450 [Candidatus Dormibacteraeota bacterium]
MPAPRSPRRRRHSLRRFIRVYQHRLARDPRRERLFLATLAFLLTFGFIRALTYSIRYNIGPFHNVSVGGTHVHHLVWGILLLLAAGYVALVEFGTRGQISNLVTRLGAIAFGVGAALTLDEFALWLNLQDVYWEKEGRLSIDAVLIFGGILMVGVFGKDLIQGLAHEVRAIVAGAEWAEGAALDELDRLERRAPQAPPGAAGGASGNRPDSPEEPVDRAT